MSTGRKKCNALDISEEHTCGRYAGHVGDHRGKGYSWKPISLADLRWQRTSDDLYLRYGEQGDRIPGCAHVSLGEPHRVLVYGPSYMPGYRIGTFATADDLEVAKDIAVTSWMWWWFHRFEPHQSTDSWAKQKAYQLPEIPPDR